MNISEILNKYDTDKNRDHTPQLWVNVVADILNPYLDYNFNKELKLSYNDIRGNTRPDNFLIVIKNIRENKVD